MRELAERGVDADAYRYADYDTPLWARSQSSPGRWHRPGDGPTQYLALEVDGAWAELIRAEAIHDDGPLLELRMPLWQLRIHQARVADLSTPDRAAAAGIRAEALVADDWSACQALGADLRADGWLGVLAPSAALPGATNLVLFGARYAVRWGPAPVLTSAVPARVLTRGAPPAGLVGRVRHRGSA